MRITVSLPEPLLDEVKAVAKEICVSRSRLVQAVLEDFLVRRGGEEFTEAIDRYLTKRGSGLSEESEPWRAQDSDQSRPARRPNESRTASRKIAVSIPADLLKQLETTAKDIGLSRTDLVCAALSDFFIRHNSSEMTRQLNKSYIKHPPEPDPFLDYLVLEGMRRTEYEE